MAKLSKAKSALGGKKAKLSASRKKAVRRRVDRVRSARSKTVSFFIGVITVLLIGFMIFQYAQQNNYKTVLGEKTQILEQNPR